jgi:hypothetical protein
MKHSRSSSPPRVLGKRPRSPPVSSTPSASVLLPKDQEELNRACLLVTQTELVVQRLAQRHLVCVSPVAARIEQLQKESKEQQERMTRLALQIWFTHNFTDACPGDGPRSIPRSRLREICNEFLQNVGLPPVAKQDAIWKDWFLKQCVGMSERDYKLAKEVPVFDGRSLPNFLRTLEDLTSAVRQEIIINHTG